MPRLDSIVAWVAALAILLAGPVMSLAECLRCPPDCPMHAKRVAAEHDAQGASAMTHDHHQHGSPAHDDAAPDHHQHHTAVAAAQDGASLSTPGHQDCHRGKQPKRADGPCISGTCGHMDVSIARVLPEGVLQSPRLAAPEIVCSTPPAAPAARPTMLPIEPPTQPPRSLPA